MLKYGTRGVAALTKHVQRVTHVKKEVEKIHNYKLPGSGAANNIVENYGAPRCFYNVPSSSTTEVPQPTVHIGDRVANMEAMVTAFVEESLYLFHWRRLLLSYHEDNQIIRAFRLF